MLKELKLTGVGPAPEMRVEFSPRLNLLTGDNGLGKTFLLDIAWWALTRTWVDLPAWPQRRQDLKPLIAYEVVGKTAPASLVEVPFDFQRQQWKLPQRRPPMPGIVIYARVDGGFSVWDPARNYWRKLKSRAVDDPDRPEAYLFSPKEVWDGLKMEGSVVCSGLISDWVSWQKQQTEEFRRLSSALALLSPGDDIPLAPDDPTRISIEDVREFPTIRMPYGTVPLVHASAGIRRVATLAYLTVWAWQEHIAASRLLNQDPEDRMILLFDEVETHLHPQWQRRFLPALLAVIDGMRSNVSVQVLASTHAPLVLASVEPVFDPSIDSLLHLGLKNGMAVVEELAWAKQGDAVSWLVSDVFGLEQARSVEAERAIEAAEAFMRGEQEALPPALNSRDSIHQELLRVLPGHDPFWPRWIVQAECGGGARLTI